MFTDSIVIKSERRFLSRPTAPVELLELVGLDSTWTDYIRIMDQSESLVLLHYLTICKEPNSNIVDDEIMSTIGHVRGTIIDTSTNKIICRSLPYTPETTSMEAVSDENISDLEFYRAHEGSVIRVFFHDGKWLFSTHRKIDCTTSYWSGPTFGKMLEETAKFDVETFDKDLCYILLLSHDGTRLIYPVDEPQITLIGVYHKSESRFLSSSEINDLTIDSSIVWNKPIWFSSFDDFRKEYAAIDGTYRNAGLICGGKNPVKYITKEYQILRDIRGNEPHLRTRYIELRNTPEKDILTSWFDQPELYDRVEIEILSLAKTLYRGYVNRFIHKNIEQIPKEEFVTLQRCHEWHRQDRKSNRMSLDKVREILDETPSHYLLIMLNRQRAARRAMKKNAKEVQETEQTQETSQSS